MFSLKTANEFFFLVDLNILINSDLLTITIWMRYERIWSKTTPIDDSLIYSRRSIFIINQIISVWLTHAHLGSIMYTAMILDAMSRNTQKPNKNNRFVHVHGAGSNKTFSGSSLFSFLAVIALRRWVLLFLEDIKCRPDDVQIISMEFLWGSVDKAAVLTFWARVNELVYPN